MVAIVNLLLKKIMMMMMMMMDGEKANFCPHPTFMYGVVRKDLQWHACISKQCNSVLMMWTRKMTVHQSAWYTLFVITGRVQGP